MKHENTNILSFGFILKFDYTKKIHVILTDIFEIYPMFHDNRIDQWLLRTPDVLKYFPSFWFGYFHFWNKNKAKTRKKMLFVPQIKK